MKPAYLKTCASGMLKEKTRQALHHLTACTLCPRRCGVNRLQGETGFCGQGAQVRVARALAHFGEEPPISGTGGAGTVFFSGCALRCLFCQNYQISQEGLGEALTVEGLARLFLDLQQQGCHNLDLVSPTPHLPFILQALERAIPAGLTVPLVYNTHGYLLPEILDLLEGVVDIYLPDMKYGEAVNAERLSRAGDYPLHNLPAIERLFRQVGPLETDHREVAVRGLLVRHLVLPAGLSDSGKVLAGLAALSPRIPVSLMAQYRPCFRSGEIPDIDRGLEPAEYEAVISRAEALGFEEIYIQDLESVEIYNPDFTRQNPFAARED
jgi:putative pyruvate formate lyase activating enzyme